MITVAIPYFHIFSLAYVSDCSLRGSKLASSSLFPNNHFSSPLLILVGAVLPASLGSLTDRCQLGSGRQSDQTGSAFRDATVWCRLDPQGACVVWFQPQQPRLPSQLLTDVILLIDLAIFLSDTAFVLNFWVKCNAADSSHVQAGRASLLDQCFSAAALLTGGMLCFQRDFTVP